MEDIQEKIVEMFEQNRFCVLATIIKQTGSAPRGIGTKFLILEDESIIGTIGGGRLEAEVLEASKKVIEKRSPIHLNFVMKGTDVEEGEMLCGGDAEVFLEPVSPGNLTHLEILKRAVKIHRRGGSGIMATVVDENRWEEGVVPKVFIESDGQRIGTLSGKTDLDDAIVNGILDFSQEREGRTIVLQDHEEKDFELFVEPIVSDPTVHIFGGGHVSQQIVPLAALVGFKVVIIDDRPEFADQKRFPEADEVHQYSFDDVLEKLAIDETSYIVIVTRGHVHDRTVLTQALKTNARYIGMIGSRRKVGIVFKKLMEEGFRREDLDRVFSPIGLNIGAETPEEIAVSIISELIQVRAG